MGGPLTAKNCILKVSLCREINYFCNNSDGSLRVYWRPKQFLPKKRRAHIVFNVCSCSHIWAARLQLKTLVCSDTPEPHMPVPRAVPLRTSTRGAACHHSMHVKPCEASVRRAPSRRRDAMPIDARPVAMCSDTTEPHITCTQVRSLTYRYQACVVRNVAVPPPCSVSPFEPSLTFWTGLDLQKFKSFFSSQNGVSRLQSYKNS